MKLGIVGTGMISCELLQTVLPYIERIQAAALCSTPRSLDKARQLSAEYDIPFVTDDFDALLAADIDAVYLGVPNHLHASLAARAIRAGKHVICEKPLTSTIEEAQTLVSLAEKNKIFLLEAISNQYQHAYQHIRQETFTQLGEIKQVICNFSQYSSRYAAFQRGEIAPAFNPACSGGALMDLNVYNVYFVVGLFGEPKQVHYSPNIERNIDTSGVLTMQYDGFTATCIGAKSCSAPSHCTIEGTNGCLQMQGTANSCGNFSITLRNQNSTAQYSDPVFPHRMVEEFMEFERILREQDIAACKSAMKNSLIVSRILTQARRDADVWFPADQPYI